MPAYKDEKRGTWTALFYFTDWTGQRKKKQKRGFQRKKDAQEFELEFLNREQASCDMTLASLSELYFEDLERRLKSTTVDTKRHIFDTKILPVFGKQPINKITASHVRKWQSDLMGQGYAQTYLKTIHNQLSAIFNYATTYYKLQENPARIAGSIGKKDADEMEIWTIDEFKEFIGAVDKPDYKLAFSIMFWAGLRVGETLALFPTDILPSKMIDITKTVTRRKGEDTFSDPKTPKSKRRVPIPTFLYDEIQEYINTVEGMTDKDRLFYFARGTLNNKLNVYAKRAGVKRIRVHDLRHSHASLLIEMDKPILLVSERLGHEKVDTTWSTYAHLYPNKGIELAEDLDKLKF